MCLKILVSVVSMDMKWNILLWVKLYIYYLILLAVISFCNTGYVLWNKLILFGKIKNGTKETFSNRQHFTNSYIHNFFVTGIFAAFIVLLWSFNLLIVYWQHSQLLWSGPEDIRRSPHHSNCSDPLSWLSCHVCCVSCYWETFSYFPGNINRNN